MRKMTELREQLLAICERIASASVEPRDGAGQIWLLLAEADYPPEVEDFRVFVGAVSEMADHPEHEARYAEDIREEARLKLEQQRSG